MPIRIIVSYDYLLLLFVIHCCIPLLEGWTRTNTNYTCTQPFERIETDFENFWNKVHPGGVQAPGAINTDWTFLASTIRADSVHTARDNVQRIRSGSALETRLQVDRSIYQKMADGTGL